MTYDYQAFDQIFQTRFDGEWTPEFRIKCIEEDIRITNILAESALKNMKEEDKPAFLAKIGTSIQIVQGYLVWAKEQIK